jgi:carbamoyltransferase
MLVFDGSLTRTSAIVAGFNTGHNGGCAIIANGQVVAVGEERLNRRKHSDGYINALLYCLEAIGRRVTDVDLFVASSYHHRLPDGYTGHLQALGVPSSRCIAVDHHLSHAYASYYLSPFNQALVVVVDGLGNDTDTESYYFVNDGVFTKVGGNDPTRHRSSSQGAGYRAGERGPSTTPAASGVPASFLSPPLA